MLLQRMGLGVLLLVVAVAPARAVDPKYLPSDTEIVISINLRQMLESDVAKTYRNAIDQAKAFVDAQIQSNPAAKYLEKAGFDVLKDLHGITVASNGGKDLDSGIIILHGRFDAERIQAAAEEIARDSAETLKITKIAGKKVFEITPPGEKRIYASLINDKTLVACGSEEILRETIERSTATTRKALKEGFKGLLKTTSEKQSLSFVATGAALAKLLENAPVPNADAAAGILGNLDGVSAAVTLTRDIQFQLGVNTKDEETAKKTVAGANFGLLTVRTLAAQKAKEDERLQPLVEVAKTLRITSEGNNILLRGEISTENLERIIKNLPRGFNQ